MENAVGRVSTERKTIAIRGWFFEHNTLIRDPQHWLARAENTVRPHMSSCTTARPDRRCYCGMFDIEWYD